MTPAEKDIAALMRRYQGEVTDLGRAARTAPPAERPLLRTHANVKESCANELARILRRHGVIG